MECRGIHGESTEGLGSFSVTIEILFQLPDSCLLIGSGSDRGLFLFSNVI